MFYFSSLVLYIFEFTASSWPEYLKTFIENNDIQQMHFSMFIMFTLYILYKQTLLHEYILNILKCICWMSLFSML
jgi:hypothetical protein